MKWILSVALMISGFVILTMAKQFYVMMAGAFVVLIGVLIMNSARQAMTRRILDKAAARNR